MRIAVIGPSGSGKTWLSEQLASSLALRHIEIDGLFHGPEWNSATPDQLRERVAEATEGDGWVSDGTYHQIIGELVFERVETVAWLDLPVRLVIWRLLRRSYLRKKHGTVLWHGNREGPWRETIHFLVWPALKRAYENRRQLPALLARHPHVRVHRLRSDAAVRSFADGLGIAADARPS